MITGNIKDCEKYYSVHKDFKTAFEFLKSLSPDDEEGSRTFGNLKGCVSDVVKNESDEPSDLFEAHRKFIDIHYVLKGEELFGYANVDALTPTTEYNEEKDYLFLKGDITPLHLHAGEFCIAFPEDAHIPAMECGKDKREKRAIVKIAL